MSSAASVSLLVEDRTSPGNAWDEVLQENSARSEASAEDSAARVVFELEDDNAQQSVPLNEAAEEEWRLRRRDFQAGARSDEDLSGMKHKVGRFYRQQTDLINNFFFLDKVLHPDSDHNEDEREAAQKRKVQAALYSSIAGNLVIVVLQLYAAISSGSIAILATMMDSILDQMVSVVIFATSYLIKKRNPYQYPAGKARLEPIGIIILSAIMATGMLQLITRSIEVLVSGQSSFALGWAQLGVLAANIVIKFGLFMYCRLVKGSPSVAALAQDHINDVVLITVGTGFALVGFYVYWLLDPLGGLLVSLYICGRWLRTGLRQTRDLTGRSAPPEFLQMMTYACLNHDRRILKIDTVRAFHLGVGYLVEIDIVLPEDMRLKEAHDIGQTLQDKLERLLQVERCFVHLDYECDHRPEHVSDRKIALDLGDD